MMNPFKIHQCLRVGFSPGKGALMLMRYLYGKDM